MKEANGCKHIKCMKAVCRKKYVCERGSFYGSHVLSGMLLWRCAKASQAAAVKLYALPQAMQAL
jgi:hypothetical protein